MKLTPKQVAYINQQREVLIQVIEAKKKSNAPIGIIRDYTRLDALKLIIELHNLEIQNSEEKPDV